MTTAFCLALLACNGNDGGTKDDVDPVDRDGDGFFDGEDCDDTDAAVWPGATDEWYDGIDADCAGNDDFDQDADGHPSDDYEGDDCDDSNADVSPSATEIPYDGLDNDCDPTTLDVDPDGDGFEPPEDCDDQDPRAFPGAAEILEDGLDFDCDGGDNTAAFTLGDLVVNEPRSVRLDATDGHIGLGFAALLIDGGGLAEAQNNAAGVLFFEPDAGGAVDPVYGPVIYQAEEPIGQVDVVGVGPDLWAAVAYFSENNLFGWLVLDQLLFVPGVGYIQAQVSSVQSVLAEFDHVEAAVDEAGVPWACASDVDSLIYLRGDQPFPSDGAAVEGVDGASGCFFEPGATAPLPLNLCDGAGACTTYDTDPDAGSVTVSASQPHAADVWLAVRERRGLAVARTDATGVVAFDDSQSWDLLSDHTVLDADAALDSGGDIWVSAVIDDGTGPELLVAWGPPGGSLTEQVFPVARGTVPLVPSETAIYVTDQRVVLSATAADYGGGSDALGWVFLIR